MGICLEALFEEDGRMEAWILQHEGGDMMSIQDLDEDFQEALRKVKERETGIIPEGVDVV